MKLYKDLIVGRKYKNTSNDIIYLLKEITEDVVIFVVKPNESNEFQTKRLSCWPADSFELISEPKNMLKERLSRDNE